MGSSLRAKLGRRAEAIALARSFFAERDIIEVDCLALSPKASIDVNIDLFSTDSSLHGRRFLFSSPEFPMKRLLSRGSGDIFYLGHVWRHEESGAKHSPEFLLAEWYRIGISFSQMMEETVEFAETFIGKRNHNRLSYKDAFLRYAKIDPFTVSPLQLKEACKGFEGYPINDSSPDELLNLLLAIKVEPCLDPHSITILYHYPSSQAALARQINDNTHLVAERFEIYCEGLELANGYHELADPSEQKSRFLADNAHRQNMGKEAYPIDENFLSALKRGLPDCCGVAVGVDRLLMIREGATSIGDVMPIAWECSTS